jgi:hypothetical protein
LIGDGDDVVVGRQHVFREAAVRAESHELSTAAELFVAFVALSAGAVAPIGVNHYPITF